MFLVVSICCSYPSYNYDILTIQLYICYVLQRNDTL